MRLPHQRVPLILFGFSLMMAGCITRADIEEIKQNQKDIMSKLDKAQKAAPSKPKPRRPRGPDPKKVYSFPVADSPTRGPKDAWVTLIEVSDFQ